MTAGPSNDAVRDADGAGDETGRRDRIEAGARDNNSNRALAAVLDDAPGGVAVFVGDREIAGDELRAHAATFADTLRIADVGPGQVVAVMLPNSADTVAALFGVWQAGGVYAPLNPRAAHDEVLGNLEAIDATMLLTTPDHPVLSAIPSSKPIVSAPTWVAVRLGGSHVAQPPDVALVQFTSGTTGRPKPVPLRHDTVLGLLDKVVATLRGSSGGSSGRTSTQGRRPPMPNLVPVSLSLWAGIYQVLFAFRVGAPVVLMDRFDTGEFARLVARHGIRSTVLPPAAMVMLTDDDAVTDLTPLRMVRSITAPLSPGQARRFRDRFRVTVLNSYGQTELGGEVIGWSAADAREHGDDKLGSVGRPHAGVEVRVAPGVDAGGDDLDARDLDNDALGTDRLTAAGHDNEGPGNNALDAVGELEVRTPATRDGSVPTDLGDRLDADGWFRTGDLGRVDADGFVWIEGRVSDMINRGGLKVFPAQVEEVLLGSPLVRDVAVVGTPDDRLGEVPVAFVVPASAPIDTAALDTWCRERLSPYKVPARYVEIDALPRNEVGKVRKVDLVERAAG